MDRWLAKIVALLEGDQRDHRRAAARVLGALKPSSPEVVKALGGVLESEDRRLRVRALDALDAIGGPQIQEYVLPLLDEPGDLGQRAADTLATLGPKVLADLKKRFAAAGPTARERMLQIAVQLRGADGMDLILKALEMGQAEQVLHVGQRLADEMAGANARERDTLFRRIDKFLKSSAAAEKPAAVGAAVDLTARILGPKAGNRLLSYAAPSNPAYVRRCALEALARVASDATLPEAELTGLLGYLGDRDYSNVVAPSMAVLERATLTQRHSVTLLKYLRGNDPALRRFAVTALGQVETTKSAGALLGVLNGNNPDLKKRAAVSLAKQEAAVPLVVSALAGAKTPNNAWVLARILQPHAHRLQPEQVSALARAAANWLEPGDPRAEAVISILSDRHMDRLAEEGLRRVRRMKKERKAGEIVNLMRPLLRNGAAVPPEVRYEIALAEIVRGKKDVVREVRLGNVGLQALEPLVHEPEFELMTRLKREKNFLLPEEYYLIGCHFAERPFADRAFGGDLLRWLVKSFPTDNSTQAAAHKLIMEGFPPPPRPRPTPPPRKPAAKKQPAKKAPEPKKPVKKVAAKKAPAKKVPAKTTAKKASAKKAPAKKAAKKKTRS